MNQKKGAEALDLRHWKNAEIFFSHKQNYLIQQYTFWIGIKSYSGHLSALCSNQATVYKIKICRLSKSYAIIVKYYRQVSHYQFSAFLLELQSPQQILHHYPHLMTTNNPGIKIILYAYHTCIYYS